MNAIAANDFSTIASSQQQLQLIFTPCSYFPSSTQTSITDACSRQEVFQIAHGAGNDTYALLMGNNRNQISLVNTNFFTDKNLSHIDHIASIEAQVYDVNNTFPFADDESMSASTSWFRDVSSLSITCENCLSSKREEGHYFLIASRYRFIDRVVGEPLQRSARRHFTRLP